MGEIQALSCPQDLKLRRRKARKSKTGCVTCKVRRIKCDETKPACGQCSTTCRTCDFLNPSTQVPSWKPAKTPKRFKATINISNQPFPLRPKPVASLSIPFAPHEVQHFDFFRFLSATSFCRYFDGGIWGNTILQICHSEPSIRSAVVTIGALIRDQVTQTETSDTQDHTVSYTEALKAINQRLDDSVESWELAMLASILFAMMDVLSGKDRAAVAHFDSGVALLKEYSSKYPKPSALVSEISKQFHRLDVQASSYSVYYQSKLPIIPLIPPTFASIEEARETLESITAYAYQRLKLFGESHCTLPYTPLLQPIASQLSHITSLLQSWATTLKTSHLPDSTALKVLQIQHLATTIQVCTHFYRDELAYDAFMAQFNSIIELAELVLPLPKTKDSKPELIFTFDMGIIQPLYLTACKCRHPVIRRRAIAVLERSGLEGVWGGEAMAAAATWAMRIEEGDVETVLRSSSSLDGYPYPPTEISENRHTDADTDAFIPESHRLREIGVSAWRAGRKLHVVSTQRPSPSPSNNEKASERRYLKKHLGWGTNKNWQRDWTREEEERETEWWVGNWKRYLEGRPRIMREGVWEVVSHPLAL